MNEEGQPQKPFWKSKKWLLAVSTSVLMVIKSFFPQIDTQSALLILLPIITYIGGEAYIDSKH